MVKRKEMKREIKFRAWDKKALAMSPIFVLFGEFTLLGAVHDWQHHVLKDKPADGERYDSLGRLNDLEIMQFTGLYDKNDKEIFEGDITFYTADTYDDGPQPYTDVIEYVDGGFRIESNELFWAINIIEVIGNIYENPERKNINL